MNLADAKEYFDGTDENYIVTAFLRIFICNHFLMLFYQNSIFQKIIVPKTNFYMVLYSMLCFYCN